jgi:hypothetical protein
MSISYHLIKCTKITVKQSNPNSTLPDNEPPRYDDQPLNKCNFFFILCVCVCTRVINTFDSASPPDDEQDAYNDKHNMTT